MSKYVPGRSFSLDHEAVLLSVQEAARVLGVSERSVYGYLAGGKLNKVYIEGVIMLWEAEVLAFERQAPGRRREKPPLWRLPLEQNPLALTTINVQVRPSCDEQLENRLAAFCAAGTHCLTGSTARYIGRNRSEPAKMLIVLLWREAILPSQEQREMALDALRADLAEVCDWTMAVMEEGLVALYAG